MPRQDAKQKYDEPKTMERRTNPHGLKTEKLADALAKFAFVEALPVITGLASGYGPGRNIAGETAAGMAPKGRVQRSENIARNAAVVGVPLGGLAAMAVAHKYKLAPRLADFAARHFPGGLISDPDSERELVRQLLPGAAAIGGSLAGGAATGAAIGGLQRLRGPMGHQEKRAALKPSPMWSRIGGASSKKPLWMSQAGFTPTGFKTPAQRLSKSMDMGKVDGSKGLKPIDYGASARAAEAAAKAGSSSSSSFSSGMKMGSVMLAITKTATGQTIPVRSEKEDLETGDENQPQLAKAADDGGHGGFSQNAYSGVMNPPAMKYQSGIPPWQEPPVKTAGPPSSGEEKTAYQAFDVSDDPEVQAANAKWDRRAITGGLLGATAGGLGMGVASLPGRKILGAATGVLGGGLLGAAIGGSTTEKDRLQAIHAAQVRRHNERQYGEQPGAKTAAGFTPLGRLNSAKAIGAPRSTPAPGPSIAQIAKPKGFGMPMSGAKKGNNII